MTETRIRIMLVCAVGCVAALLGVYGINYSPKAYAEDKASGTSKVEKTEQVFPAARFPEELVQYRVKDLSVGDTAYIAYGYLSVDKDRKVWLYETVPVCKEPTPGYGDTKIMLTEGGLTVVLPLKPDKKTISDYADYKAIPVVSILRQQPPEPEKPVEEPQKDEIKAESTTTPEIPPEQEKK